MLLKIYQQMLAIILHNQQTLQNVQGIYIYILDIEPSAHNINVIMKPYQP